MIKKNVASVVASVAGIFTLLGAVAIAQQEGNMNSKKSGQDGSTSQRMTLSSTDRKFMMEAAMGGMAEVEMARLALQRASSEDVKKYAQQMVDDHTKANEELMQVAQSKGVTLPAGIDARHMALMEKMRNLSGMEFDRMYIKEAGVKDHAKMEKLFMKESANGKDADARAFAAKTLPVVQMHLRMAREMTNGMMTGGMKAKM